MKPYFGSQNGSKIAPKLPQDGPKMAPRWPLGGSLGPRWSQRAPKLEKNNFLIFSWSHVGAQVGSQISTFLLQEWFRRGFKTKLDYMLRQDTNLQAKMSLVGPPLDMNNQANPLEGCQHLRFLVSLWKSLLEAISGRFLGRFWAPSWGQVGPCLAFSWLKMVIQHNTKNHI